MTVQLDNETAIKCTRHVVDNKINYGTGDAVNDILAIISEQGADYIIQEFLERLVNDKD